MSETMTPAMTATTCWHRGQCPDCHPFMGILCWHCARYALDAEPLSIDEAIKVCLRLGDFK